MMQQIMIAFHQLAVTLKSYRLCLIFTILTPITSLHTDEVEISASPMFRLYLYMGLYFVPETTRRDTAKLGMLSGFGNLS